MTVPERNWGRGERSGPGSAEEGPGVSTEKRGVTTPVGSPAATDR